VCEQCSEVVVMLQLLTTRVLIVCLLSNIVVIHLK